MKILVIGGFGFLGGRIVRHFLNKGHNVVVGTYRESNLNNANLNEADILQIPWKDPLKLNGLFSGVDVIVHASGMNAKECYEDPVQAVNVNVIATANILRTAINQNVRKFLYISTIHVYSDKLQGVISEETCPNNLHPYAATHRAAEDAVLWAQKTKMIDGIVVRFSNGFGVPARRDANCWKLLINGLCRQAIEQKKLVLESDGKDVRNFIPIPEICSAIDFLLCRLPNDQLVGDVGPINIGGPGSYSVLEMANLVQSRCIEILGYKPDLVIPKIKKVNEIIDLDFQQHKLRSLGYSHSYDVKNEVDNLLKYCMKTFYRE